MTTDHRRNLLTQPGGLAGQLRLMRERANITGVMLADATGMTSSKVSKIEGGKQVPSTADIEAWCAACSQPAKVTELVGLAEQVQAEHRAWRARLREDGHVGVQADLEFIGEAAHRIRCFQVSVFPGLLQTPEYAGEVIRKSAVRHERPDDDIDASVAGRMRRQQVLYDPGKEFEFLLDESVLLRPVHGVDVTARQVDRLHSIIGLGNIRFGIIPMNRALETTPLHGFILFDDVALVETYVGEIRPEGDEAAAFHKTMDRLWGDAVEGEAARDRLTGASAKLRRFS